MKNLLNKIFGISQRAIGNVDDKGNVGITEIISYDIVANPHFSNARIDFSEINELNKQIQTEIKRQELLKTRKEKIQKLNNI